ncbi:hypothetical protein A6M27_16750 [Acidithiobacillus thiooxidans]|uniref:PAS domain-containing protein n=1 Tax=Acidithiobacillus thiooxidans TaxID=930 RepID=A0A1C2IQK6_ACITH|nr:hypothetical protein [Acidithiobacillus thiooxidans]MBU2841399.1 hypothetical protein [Acidithiobacillus thiooxidans]OCX70030.1 hypothetical protein A6O24_17105 [Acidithiobacillus thiooxidans]OCX70082.1 hypothetical protein A6P07_15315 [Acidithiobacillus thiooxidans]OCX78336.1 hypothetical protein A6O26_18240 [Acidithiobacillus thiooxidans]OCX84070.1 hypothetical protein A6M27_16750 [Acidithiobacillus thiooxidans]
MMLEGLSHQNELLTLLIEALPDAVFLKDGMGRWQVANEATIRLYHLRDIPWRNKTDAQLADLHPEFRTIHEEHSQT